MAIFALFPKKIRYFSGMAILAVVPILLTFSGKEYDIMAQMREAFDYFISSGQVWALIIGFVLGYIFRNFTAY